MTEIKSSVYDKKVEYSTFKILFISFEFKRKIEIFLRCVKKN